MPCVQRVGSTSHTIRTSGGNSEDRASCYVRTRARTRIQGSCVRRAFAAQVASRTRSILHARRQSREVEIQTFQSHAAGKQEARNRCGVDPRSTMTEALGQMPMAPADAAVTPSGCSSDMQNIGFPKHRRHVDRGPRRKSAHLQEVVGEPMSKTPPSEDFAMHFGYMTPCPAEEHVSLREATSTSTSTATKSPSSGRVLNKSRLTNTSRRWPRRRWSSSRARFTRTTAAGRSWRRLLGPWWNT